MIRMKKQVVTAVLLSGVLALLPGCWPFGKKDVQEQKPSLYVINVLDKESYDDCNIAGSVNVPFKDVESFAKDLDRNAEVVVYCANYMCTASGAAAQKLKEMGFEKVWAYEGGTAEWYQLGKANGDYPVTGSCSASYLTAANAKPTEEATDVAVITADQLREKMIAHGLISVAQTQAPAQEGSQQAAA
jgi:rhodanese-related sulfurtransferase